MFNFLTKITGFLLLVILCTGCWMHDRWNDVAQDGDTAIPDKFKNIRLKAATPSDGGRVYEYVYREDGLLDYIHAFTPGTTIDYKYKATYSGTRLTAVDLINSFGITESSHKNFVYDSKGNIVKYDYVFYIEDGTEAVTSHTLVYDNRNRIEIIDNYYRLTYSARNDVTVWTKDYLNNPTSTTYEYDTKLNPYYFIENLFFFYVEEEAERSLGLSQHNVTASNILNEYDMGGQRLIKRSFLDDSGAVIHSVTYSYY